MAPFPYKSLRGKPQEIANIYRYPMPSGVLASPVLQQLYWLPPKAQSPFPCLPGKSNPSLALVSKIFCNVDNYLVTDLRNRREPLHDRVGTTNVRRTDCNISQSNPLLPLYKDFNTRLLQTSAVTDVVIFCYNAQRFIEVPFNAGKRMEQGTGVQIVKGSWGISKHLFNPWGEL
jgi:hypothetical protein